MESSPYYGFAAVLCGKASPFRVVANYSEAEPPSGEPLFLFSVLQKGIAIPHIERAEPKKELFLRIREFDRVHAAQDDLLPADDAFAILCGVEDVEWAGDHRREKRGFVACEIGRALFEVNARRGFGTVNAIAPLYDIQVQLEDALLGEITFQEVCVRGLAAFS